MDWNMENNFFENKVALSWYYLNRISKPTTLRRFTTDPWSSYDANLHKGSLPLFFYVEKSEILPLL